MPVFPWNGNVALARRTVRTVQRVFFLVYASARLTIYIEDPPRPFSEFLLYYVGIPLVLFGVAVGIYILIDRLKYRQAVARRKKVKIHNPKLPPPAKQGRPKNLWAGKRLRNGKQWRKRSR